MDVDFKPPQENGAKTEADLVEKEKAPPDADTNGTVKDSPKHNTRGKRGQRRSRSRTPQTKTEETKTLQVSLQKINADLNGKDLKEEDEKTEENGDGNVLNDKAKNDEILDKSKEETDKNDKQSKKQKEADVKKGENGKEEDSQQMEEPAKVEPPKRVSPRKAKQQDSNQPNEFESETIEMDPLIISDEVDPELQFDETSDMESGKGSPVIPRCRTRRSQTRNIPTPKTPKSVEQDVDSEKNSIVPTTTDLIENNTDLPKTDKLDDTQDSAETDNLSTRAEAGGDITRMDFIENHNSYLTDDSYLNASRERSLSETLRSLSARRPIRPLDDYRRRAIRINQERSDLNMPFESEHIATGQKRKNRSTTPEDRKKFKSDSPSSLFSSPLATLRNKFRSDLPSSTPKLLGYRDGQSELHFNDEQNMVYNGDDEKKSWCSIM